MFTCRSCMRRHIHNLLGNPVLYQSGQRNTVFPKHTGKVFERNYTAKRSRILPRSGKTSGKSLAASAVRKELRYLGDPLKLADHVFELLRQDRFGEAEIFVQTASKSFPCTVSWNHLVDWQLRQGKVNVAIKTYNEMKKRGQKPDAHTYTILFRGLAEFVHYPEALSKALSIYHSMDAENSPVQPNVAHTNAVLKVCARAKDMDALHGIVAKLQRKGLRAPNNLTYTTIFNAIRQQAAESSGSLAADEVECRAICERAITEARKLWIEVIERWCHGDIWIDEELTCSIGRILLMGGRQDIYDVFSLIEQTMNIPRLVPKDGADVGNQTDSTVQDTIQNPNGEDVSSLVENSEKNKLLYDEFKIVRPPKPLPQRSSAYAKPGQNSLSLVLEALKDVRMRRPLDAYWEVFTNFHKVVPDSNNFHTYLRILRLQRASAETVKVLLQMPKEMLEKKTFRIAMSTCARDKNNKNCFANAGKILDLMQQSLSDLDLPTLNKYMEVALYGGSNFGALPARGGSAEPDYARGRQILRALDRLGPCVINVRSALAYNERPPSKSEGESQAEKDQTSALALVREMISAYDKLINNGMVAQEMNIGLKRERSKLAAFVTRYNPMNFARKGTDGSKARIREERSNNPAVDEIVKQRYGG